MSDPVSEKFLRLKVIMDELREGCPWDRKQTIATLRPLTIEETYELADAVTDSDWPGIREELGDLMLHILFYSRIGTEKGEFTLEEVLDGISEKLVKRHPHIYGDVQVKDEEDVKRNWERIKLEEGKTSVLGGVPRSLPAMVKSLRLQEKARQVGFEWQEAAQVWAKVEEEAAELRELAKDADGVPGFEPVDEKWRESVESELGDLLFSIVNYSRFLGVDPENALERTNRKFISRFQKMEGMARDKGLSLSAMTLAEMDGLWDEVKKEEPR
jgi:XTP/dITP diphosphohydrolase